MFGLGMEGSAAIGSAVFKRLFVLSSVFILLASTFNAQVPTWLSVDLPLYLPTYHVKSQRSPYTGQSRNLL